jgi:hypothetical protein
MSNKEDCTKWSKNIYNIYNSDGKLLTNKPVSEEELPEVRKKLEESGNIISIRQVLFD